MRGRCLGVVAIVASTVGSTAGVASAEPGASDVARAEALFHEGEGLFDGKQYAEACAAFDASERLDPQLGTLLNLAFCREALGQTATAWRQYSSGAAWASLRGQRDRQAWALTRAVDLSARLSLVSLEVPAEVASYAIAVDGAPVPALEWATPTPLDPGAHVVRVSAPGRRAREIAVHVSDGPSAQTVAIPRLEPSDDRPGAPAPPAPAPGPSGRLVVGAFALGAGAAAIGAGAYFGLTAFAKKSDASAHCVGSECDATGVALGDDAHTAATASTISFAAGLVVLGVGTWLALTSPGSTPRSASAWLPVVARGGSTLGIGAQW